MKYAFATALLIATAFVVRADDKPIAEKARDTAGTVVEKTKEIAHDAKDIAVDAAQRAGRATRDAWEKTKAYVSEEMPVYHEGAQATLANLEKEIAELKAQTPGAAPAYFRTRLTALDEQHEHLVKRLAQLSPEQLKDRSSGPRYDFDRCVGDLEKAVDQARDGTGTLTKGDRK